MPMKVEIFEEITKFIKNDNGLSKHCAEKLIKQFPDVNPHSLRSILGYYWRFKGAKANASHIRDQIHSDYKKALHNNEPTGIMVRLAVKFDVPPTSVAKIILENYLTTLNESNDSESQKLKVSRYLKDTTLINDMDMAYEVFLAVLNDDQFGSVADAVKHAIGLEYERKLSHVARQNGLIFKDEEVLRKDGYDKTPDIKLDVPVAINGFIISWIESKALFGHPKVHQGYMKDQYISYWNRFGPGLIIYWLGYVETIINPMEKRFIVSDHFPEQIVLMSPKSIEPSLKL